MTSSLPPMIIFINGDITYPPVPPPNPPYFIGANPNNSHSDAGFSELTNLQSQLFIDDTITKTEFDARVAADPNYPTIIHLQGLRVLVILPTFQDYNNRQLADVVIFLHQGLADIEKNNFGPPCQNYEIQRLTIYELLNANNSCCFVPFYALPQCGCCSYPFYCDSCHTFSGIKLCSGCGCQCKCGCELIDNQGLKYSPIYLPNCDNEAHNIDFINRK